MEGLRHHCRQEGGQLDGGLGLVVEPEEVELKMPEAHYNSKPVFLRSQAAVVALRVAAGKRRAAHDIATVFLLRKKYFEIRDL